MRVVLLLLLIAVVTAQTQQTQQRPTTTTTQVATAPTTTGANTQVTQQQPSQQQSIADKLDEKAIQQHQKAAAHALTWHKKHKKWAKAAKAAADEYQKRYVDAFNRRNHHRGLRTFHRQKLKQAKKKHAFHKRNHIDNQQKLQDVNKQIDSVTNKLRQQSKAFDANSEQLISATAQQKKLATKLANLEKERERLSKAINYHSNRKGYWNNQIKIESGLVKVYNGRSVQFQRAAENALQNWRSASSRQTAHTATANKWQATYNARLAAHNTNMNKFNTAHSAYVTARDGYRNFLNQARLSYKALRAAKIQLDQAALDVKKAKKRQNKHARRYNRNKKRQTRYEQRVARHQKKLKQATAKRNYHQGRFQFHRNRALSFKTALSNASNKRKEVRSAVITARDNTRRHVADMNAANKKHNDLFNRHKNHAKIAVREARSRDFWNSRVAFHKSQLSKAQTRLTAVRERQQRLNKKATQARNSRDKHNRLSANHRVSVTHHAHQLQLAKRSLNTV